jgi:hypothetical protein
MRLDHRQHRLARARHVAAEQEPDAVDLEQTFGEGAEFTGSTGRPSTPPLALISSIASSVALSWVRSIVDVTPVCENNTPTRQLPVFSSNNAIISQIAPLDRRLPPIDSSNVITEWIRLETCLLNEWGSREHSRAGDAGRRRRTARTLRGPNTRAEGSEARPARGDAIARPLSSAPRR